MPKTARYKQVPVRLSPLTHRRLKAAVKKERPTRSINAQLEYMIEDYLSTKEGNK